MAKSKQHVFLILHNCPFCISIWWNDSVDSVIFGGDLVAFDRLIRNVSTLIIPTGTPDFFLSMVDKNKIVYKIATNVVILLTLSWLLIWWF